MTPPGRRLKVVSVVRETRDAVSVVLDVPADSAAAFRYRPGQFLTVRVPAPSGRWVARCYSLSGAPEDGPLTITVKRVADGIASSWICEELEPGHEIEVLPPAGNFVPRDEARELLLFAGGSGITPIMSILRARLARPGGSAVLVYANRDDQSVIFADELRALATAHPDRLLVLHLLESVQGLPTVDHLARLCRPSGAADLAMLCGPGPFMEVAADALSRIGVPGDRVVTEKFRSLESDPFADVRTDPVDQEAAATVTVELDGERRTLAWPAQTPLLDLLRGQGMDAPFSCREGACSACACRLLSGEVQMLRNEVLEKEDLAEGYVLACQAVPVTEHIEITYD
ncbi:ferredoxin--NADP reductase [Amycolatopsis sp. YIM 10]|uniref:ferredoxin--NADP reductase n=1 Tax=Amycolatopsis sp. YIM 10 TaxID=2653857 RepID=UPI00128FE37A|nr:ferredoxin--NADP reductase [Amycolatopsis sp. YIM 10]QFU92505.1 3-ketosteroid-9-alpha-hydroxylase reductase subunit [Amycolatopsis sp. YIM 10]